MTQNNNICATPAPILLHSDYYRPSDKDQVKPFFVLPLKFSWYLCLLSAVVLSLCTPAFAQDHNRPSFWATPVELAHTENFYQITPNLYRSAQPSAAAFESLEKFGIKTIINLRAKHSDRKWLKGGSSLRLIEVPIKTWDIDNSEVIEVLRLIKSEPGPILIHCQHGADRTGLMVAMYRLIFENWTKDEALDELINGGYGFHKIWKNIPQYIKDVNVDQIRAEVLKPQKSR